MQTSDSHSDSSAMQLDRKLKLLCSQSLVELVICSHFFYLKDEEIELSIAFVGVDALVFK